MKPWGRLFAPLMLGLAVAGTVSFGALADPVTVRFWIHEHPPRLPVEQEILAAFAKAHPDIKIEYTVMPFADFGPKLTTAFATGSAPDLFNQFSVDVGQYKAANLIVPMDLAAAGFADDAALHARFLNGLDGITFGGKAYGLPTEVSNFFCYTNNKMWKEKGLDPAKDFPKTWEDMVTVAEKLTTRDAAGVPVKRGFDFNWNGSIFMWLIVNPMVRQAGGSLVDEVQLQGDDEHAGTRQDVPVLGRLGEQVEAWRSAIHG